MTDVANATELPDVATLKSPPALPDVNTLLPPSGTPMRGMKGMPEYPQAVLNRLSKGDAVTPVIGKLINGFATGYGNSFNAITADDEQKARDAGMLPNSPDYFDGGIGALRMMRNQLTAAASFIKAGTLSIFPGILSATEQGTTEAGKQAGMKNPGSLGREIAGDLEIAAQDAGIQTMLMSGGMYSEATRLQRFPDGSHADVRIGPVPAPAEAATQAETVAQHFGLPDAAPVIQKAYEQGVLPAEIHFDATSNPAVLGDLAAGEVPKAYPVQDWTGAPGSPEGAAVAPVEGAAKVPTPAGKLPAGAPRPIAGTGEETARGLSQSTEAAAIQNGLAESFPDLPTYNRVTDVDQGAKALGVLEKDPESALAIAMGTKAPPRGVLPEAVYVAVKNKAVADGDIETMRSLATQSTLTQQATTMGQRISYLRNVNPENDPVAAIQQVQAARAEALKAKGIDIAANSNEALAEYQPIRAATRAAKPVSAWEKFTASIRCAE